MIGRNGAPKSPSTMGPARQAPASPYILHPHHHARHVIRLRRVTPEGSHGLKQRLNGCRHQCAVVIEGVGIQFWINLGSLVAKGLAERPKDSKAPADISG